MKTIKINKSLTTAIKTTIDPGLVKKYKNLFKGISTVSLCFNNVFLAADKKGALCLDFSDSKL